MAYLAAFKQKGVPDVQISFEWHSVYKDTEKPIEGEQGWIHSMFVEMLAQLGQFFCE